MLHHLVFALAAVLTALDLAPVHLCIRLMRLHMTAEIRLTLNMRAAFCADHTGLGGCCGVGYVGCLSNGMSQWWCSSCKLVMAIIVGAMARNTQRVESLGESTFTNSSEAIRWHVTNRIKIIIAADVNRVERIWPSVTGIAESSWCVVEVFKRGSMICWGNISETRMEPLRRPVATSNGEVAGCGRCLLAPGVYDGMRFQKLGG